MADTKKTTKAGGSASDKRIDDQKLKGVSGGKSNISGKFDKTGDAIAQNLRG